MQNIGHANVGCTDFRITNDQFASNQLVHRWCIGQQRQLVFQLNLSHAFDRRDSCRRSRRNSAPRRSLRMHAHAGEDASAGTLCVCCNTIRYAHRPFSPSPTNKVYNSSRPNASTSPAHKGPTSRCGPLTFSTGPQPPRRHPPCERPWLRRPNLRSTRFWRLCP